MNKNKKNQNAYIADEVKVVIGHDKKDKKDKPVYAKADVVTTMTQLTIVYHGKIFGSAGVVRKEDFDYDALLAIAKADMNISI